LSITGLTAITLLSNIGTFLLYGMTNIIALVAFLRHPQRNALTHIIVPVLGLLANVGMLLAVVYLGVAGGGVTRAAAMVAIVTTLIWLVVGIIYFVSNTRATGRKFVADYNA
jgi:ABC-type polysaccharide/polyol phosphate export permease